MVILKIIRVSSFKSFLKNLDNFNCWFGQIVSLESKSLSILTCNKILIYFWAKSYVFHIENFSDFQFEMCV